MAQDIAAFVAGLIAAVCLLGWQGPVSKYMQASLADASAQARTVR
jgi:ferric-dicitrate binding protein FerR (iron transport regulator)